MKMKLLILVPLLALPLLGLAQEGGKPGKASAKTAAVAAAKAAKAKEAAALAAAKKELWICPMHDGGESTHAGKCPKCGMDLVKQKKSKGAQ